MTPRQQVYDAIKAARIGFSSWLTMPYEGVEYRFQLMALRPLAEGEVWSAYSLRHRGTTYVAVNEADWPIGYGWCLGKVRGRIRLVQLTTDESGQFHVEGHRRQDDAVLAILRGGWDAIHRRDTTPCGGTGKPLNQAFYGGGAVCPRCNQWYQKKSAGQMTPKHFSSSV